MNGLDAIGIARQSLQRRRLIGPEPHGKVVLLRIQRWEVEPSQRVFEIAPDPLKRIQLRTIRR